MKKLLIFALMAIVMTGCVAEVALVESCTEPVGFWYGMWHGIIAPVTMIAQLSMDNVAMYAVNNNGGWYDFGFVLGIGGLATSTS